MSKYRPKELVIYFYGTIYKSSISCYPQSKWELLKETFEKVTLKNKNVVIDIAREDFKKQWVEVKK